VELGVVASLGFLFRKNGIHQRRLVKRQEPFFYMIPSTCSLVANQLKGSISIVVHMISLVLSHLT
jgi:hypothetical protein